MNLEKELINDDRLTPTMDRYRSGSKQYFKERNPTNMEPILRNTDLTLEHPTDVAMYAELIDEKWYWVTGCAECKGETRDWMSYVECDKHNICKVCSINTKDLAEGIIRWSSKTGWTCGTCHDARDLEIREAAFEKFNSDDHDDWYFHSNDEIICPHCGSKLGTDDMHESQDIDCYVCDGQIEVEVEYSLTYTTKIKGKRITK